MIKEVPVAVVNDPPRRVKLPGAILLAVALMVGGLGASEWLKPSRVVADELPPIVMKELLPQRFGDWRVDHSGPAVIYDPTVEAKLATLYSGTLNVTYVNSQGQPVMLSLAYGKNQNSWSTAAHRPEFCYSAQGFEVQGRGQGKLALTGHEIDVIRLMSSRGQQIEPITYWVTLHDTAALPGLSRKLQQLRYGLQGMIVDGFLFRISSLGTDEAEQFKLQERFVRDLEAALPPETRLRLFGKP
jgi:EpsI family protein